MSTDTTQLNPPSDRTLGTTLLAALLIATPLVQWAYVSALSYFTILEPPFTGSRGIPLAIQLFFAPGNIIAVALGVGLLLRSEWTRWIARVVFGLAFAFTAWLIGEQAATLRFDSNVLLALLSLTISAACVWYFGLRRVRAEFRPREAPGATVEAGPAARPAPYSRSMIVAACVEIALGLAAALLVAQLYAQFFDRPLLDVGPGIGVTEADEFLRSVLFVAFALFLSPHALTTYASAGILFGWDTTRTMRRHAWIACWTVVGAALIAAWLASREGVAFDPRSVQLIYAFCAVSLVWHACLLVILARLPSTR